jgi:hypothetical protein
MMNLETYLASLKTVETTSLPIGALFVANYLIYEIIDSGINEDHKARQWRKSQATEMALSTESSLALRLPVIIYGKWLPPYPSRDDLRVGGEPLIFAFTTEQNALEAAFLDVALCGSKSSLYVRRNERTPAFEVTNGLLLFRQYYFMRTTQGEKTNLPDIKHQLDKRLLPHHQGPLYWRLLLSWDESPYDLDQTVAYDPAYIEEMLRRLDSTSPGENK